MTSPVEPKFELPPELWEQIFGHLRGKHLLPVRQVCSRFRAIVDQKRSLWDQLRIIFKQRITLNKRFWSPESFPPATAVKFTRDIICLGSWWPPLGERLTSVGLHRLMISLATLLGMLRQTPNLEELSLFFVEYISIKEPAVDFRLEKLKRLQIIADQLAVDQEPSKSNFKSFVSMFPNVKDLEVDLQEVDKEITAQLIDSVQDTLERLKLRATDYILTKIYAMDRLQLKSFELYFLDEGHSQLDYFCEIGRNLPKLKHLAIALYYSWPEDNFVPTFLATMPQLEVLKIDFDGSEDDGDGLGVKIDFDGVQSPGMKELVLRTTEPIGDSLRTFLGGSGNIQKLRFIYCSLSSWSMLLAILKDNASMRYLTLQNSSFDVPDVPTNSKVTNLEFLELYNCPTITNEMIFHLCALSPRLRQLILASMPKLNDDTVKNLCRLLPQLTTLRLEGCSRVTGACAEDILDHCPALTYLGADRDNGLLKAVRTLLRERGGGRYIELELEKYPIFELDL